jgi:hypothetical protein
MTARIDRKLVNELCSGPRRGVVACFTCCGESRSDMIGIGDILELGSMAGVTSRGCARVLIAHVAIHALNRGVCAGQRESRARVIKCCALPLNRGVAHLALLRKSRRCMIWIGRGCVLVEVARDTRRARARKLPLFVTRSAGRRGVRSH